MSDPEFKTTCSYNPSLTTEKCPGRRQLAQDSSSSTQVPLHQQVTAAQQAANTTNTTWLLKYKCLIMQISVVQHSDHLIFSSWVTEGKVYSSYHKISTEPSPLWSTPFLNKFWKIQQSNCSCRYLFKDASLDFLFLNKYWHVPLGLL